MYIAEIIPVMRGRGVFKETLTYFTSLEIHEGDLVFIPVQKKEISGIVSSVGKLSSAKTAVRKSSFALKKISRILFPGLLPQSLIRFITEAASYYMLMPAAVAYHALPKYIIQKPHRLDKNLVSQFFETENVLRNTPAIPEKPIFLVGDLEKRIHMYKIEIIKAIKNRKQILILVPEIESAEIIYNVFLAITETRIVLLTSKLTPKKYAEEWLRVRKGDPIVIIGTRQSLFLPFCNLGLIIVDEEESPSYRIWDGVVRYDPLLVAKKLALMHRARMIVGAHIPRTETMYWAKADEAQIKIFSNTLKPAISEVVDLKKEQEEQKSFVVISRSLEEAMRRSINQKQQVILFANRRGYASFILCEDCGFMFHCPKCDTPLIFHREGIGKDKERLLSCHRCGHVTQTPETCAHCKSHLLKPYGVGTERVEEMVKQLFPKTTMMRLDSDTAGNAQGAQEKIKIFSEKKSAILIGTQIILKHSLPRAALAGVINGDGMLYLPDFRQEERVFYLIAFLKQHAKQKIILQTFDPEKEIFTLALAGNYALFYSRELKNRQQYSWPPFSRLIKLIYAHRDSMSAKKEALRLHNEIQKRFSKHYPSLESFILPAFIPRQKGKYVFHIMIKLPIRFSRGEASAISLLKQQLHEMLSLAWRVEVDPENLL